MGIRQPGVQLLSLDKSGPGTGDYLCLMPDQIGIYLDVYLPLILLSLLVIAVANLCMPYSTQRLTRSPPMNGSGVRSRPEDDDKNFKLPLPVSYRPGWRKWTFFGPRSDPILWFRRFFSTMPRQSGKQHGFIRRFLVDVRDIAVFPLATVALTWLWSYR